MKEMEILEEVLDELRVCVKKLGGAHLIKVEENLDNLIKEKKQKRIRLKELYTWGSTKKVK